MRFTTSPSNRFFAKAAVCFLGLYGNLSGLASAANISFVGAFERDDQAIIFSIDADSQALVTIRSVGYAGDNIPDRGVIPAGGFDSYLTLFDEAGHFVTENDDGQNVGVDPATGQGFDASIVWNLDPGHYFFTLTQYGNYALGGEHNDGFRQTGNPSYTGDPGFAPGGPCSGGKFKDSSGNCRTGNYAVEFLNISGASAYYSVLDAPLLPVAVASPEPGTGAMLLTTLFSLGVFLYRKRPVGTIMLKSDGHDWKREVQPSSNLDRQAAIPVVSGGMHIVEETLRPVPQS